MCRETISVCGVGNERSTYEVEQYLIGIPGVEDASVRFDGSLIIEYDESILDRDDVLDEIEHAGSKAAERCSMLERAKYAVLGS